jgi:hypothetical protein
MRNLLRILMLAVLLVPALAVPSAKALAAPSTLEACADDTGRCSISSETHCVRSPDCPPGETCIC